MFGNPSYPTYQAFLGLGIAAAIALLLMPWWIKLLKVEGIGQQVRADGPKRHLVKQGTPTMGGVVILVAISLTCLLMGKLTNREAQVLERIVAGRLKKQIADDLGISIKTVEAHRANIMEKMGANTVADLLKIALGPSAAKA